MSVGVETLKEESKKRQTEKEMIVDTKYPFFLKRSLSGFILLFCAVIFFLSIAYFPKSSKEITTLKINFQDSGSIPPTGWLSDFGQPYGVRKSSNQGRGFAYGWVKRSDKKPV